MTPTLIPLVIHKDLPILTGLGHVAHEPNDTELAIAYLYAQEQKRARQAEQAEQAEKSPQKQG